jgi:hypothetical protein
MPTNTEKYLPCFAAAIEGAAAIADLSGNGCSLNNPTTTTTMMLMEAAAAAAGIGGTYIVAFAACLPAATGCFCWPRARSLVCVASSVQQQPRVTNPSIFTVPNRTRRRYPYGVSRIRRRSSGGRLWRLLAHGSLAPRYDVNVPSLIPGCNILQLQYQLTYQTHQQQPHHHHWNHPQIIQSYSPKTTTTTTTTTAESWFPTTLLVSNSFD